MFGEFGRNVVVDLTLPATQTTTAGIYDNPASHVLTVPANKIGTTMGGAYARTTKLVYAAAFFKKYAGLGPSGPGAIYVIYPTSK